MKFREDFIEQMRSSYGQAVSNSKSHSSIAHRCLQVNAALFSITNIMLIYELLPWHYSLAELESRANAEVGW